MPPPITPQMDRLGQKPLPRAVASLAVALFVTFLPLAVNELRARRRAAPIRIVATGEAPADSLGGQACWEVGDGVVPSVDPVPSLVSPIYEVLSR
jgi:hypothetical protein